METQQLKHSYSRAVYSGLVTFFLLFFITQFLNYKIYQKSEEEEYQRTVNESISITSRLQSSLNYSLSATKSLAFLIQENGVPDNFEFIAEGLLQANQYIDAIQLVQGGVITNVFPIEGNESVIGYDILADTLVNREAFEAIEKRELYFAGPINLRQGGVAVIGRLPIFIDDDFFGFSAVIIKIPTLLEAAGINLNSSSYDYMLSKINRNTEVEEFFISTSDFEIDADVVKSNILVGEWTLYVKPELPNTIFNSLPFAILGFLFSLIGAVFIWYVSKQPIELKHLVEEKSNQILQQERKYRALLENGTDGIVVLNAEGNPVYVTPSVEHILGYSKEEAFNLNLFELMHPDDVEKIQGIMMKVLESPGIPIKGFPGRTKHKNGTWRYLDATITNMIHDPSIGGIVDNFRDVTDRVQAENAKEYERQNKEALINSTQDLIWSVATDFRLITANEAFLQNLKDYTGNELKPGDDLIMAGKYPIDFLEFWSKLYKRALDGESFQQVVYIPPIDGATESWADISFSPIIIDSKIEGIACYSRDITEVKLSEIALQKAFKEKNEILESIGDGFYAVDKTWKVTYWNYHAENLLQRKREEMIGANLWDKFPETVKLSFYQHYQAALSTGLVSHFEEYFPPLSAWFEVSAYPSSNGLAVYFKDVTERKQTEKQLQELNEDLIRQAKELEISNKELEQFAYVASHDLQEPLRMITGFLTLIEKKYNEILDERGKKYIYFAIDGAKRMRQIILDLLEFSRLSNSDEEIELVDLQDIMNEVLVLNRKTISENRARIKFENLPKLRAVRVSMLQLFQNLVNNGLKYKREGVQPTVSINAKEIGDFWQFSVNDNGIGIDKNYFDRIFVIFQRLNRKEEYSGTGMGLAICKKVIEGMGGRIWVESEKGIGSTFYFTLPKTT
ncbi:PAS domain S-box protein [Peijinzhouia sedimentorum]